MGVPAFFKWLSSKYPSIVTYCVERKPDIDDQGKPIWEDASLPNPNEVEFDNLYLDMNGIIHPCTHPENKAAPKNESEMFVAIFEYIDRLFNTCRPRRLIYMAVDGVAPRAKMNQQRSRRFRAAQESYERTQTISRVRSELEARGANLPPEKSEKEHFDSNCITPGTPFMARLSIALRYYIYDRVNSDPGWANIQVILSDANVPGEGEHKIMDFIRKQRSSPDHDPNTRHCLCGADADLIMLGLATHEPYFTIIREEFKPNQPKPCDLCGQCGHELTDCVGVPNIEERSGGSNPPPFASETDFIFIHLSVLRQYLRDELYINDLPFEWDLERAIDDWVFMCFFVGNDFLPHLPSLEIREGAIDRLIKLYKITVPIAGGWFTCSGHVNLERVQGLMTSLGKMEDEIFKNRRSDELSYRARKRQNIARGVFGRGNQHGRQRTDYNPSRSTGFMAPQPTTDKPFGLVSANEVHQLRQRHDVNWIEQNLNNLEAATTMKAMLNTHSSVDMSRSENSTTVSGHSSKSSGKRRSSSELDEDEMTDKRDEVRLWEDGWRSRYYNSKFGVDPSDAAEFCITVGYEYVKGLCWVLAYYYQGCASWDWYFPYHYAPFASDFVGVAQIKIDFSRPTEPFRPLEQLMGVFPGASRFHVPPAWQDLMTNPDSPIIDFYPTDFKVDLNGKKFAWMGVALLPFVDEVRLLKVLDTRRHLLTKEEIERNIRGPDRFFIRKTHPLARMILNVYESAVAAGNTRADFLPPGSHTKGASVVPDNHNVFDPVLTEGISGRFWPDIGVAHLPGERVPSGVPALLEDLPSSQVVSVCYADPGYPIGFVFPSKLLDKVKMPPPSLLLPSTVRGRGGRGGYNNSPRDRTLRHFLPHSNNQERNAFQSGMGQGGNSFFNPSSREANQNPGYNTNRNSNNYRHNPSGYDRYSRGHNVGYNQPLNNQYNSLLPSSHYLPYQHPDSHQPSFSHQSRGGYADRYRQTPMDSHDYQDDRFRSFNNRRGNYDRRPGGNARRY